MNDQLISDRLSEFMKYLATSDLDEDGRLPPLSELKQNSWDQHCEFTRAARGRAGNGIG